jgi:rhodanese-related sulfurtransferase
MIPYIEAKELASLLLEMRKQKRENQKVSHYIALIDVRDEDFNIEGCIPQALHMASIDFQIRLPSLSDQLKFWLETYDKLTVVFYCSYSQVRGPTCAKLFSDYCKPILSHPTSSLLDIRVLKGGYTYWVSQYRDDPSLVTRFPHPLNYPT